MQQIAVERGEGRAVVLVRGEIDVMTVPDLRLTLHALLDGTYDEVVIDLAEVHFVDATGLGALVGAHRRAHRVDARIVLRDPAENVRRLLSLTRLDRVLPIATTALDPVA